MTSTRAPHRGWLLAVLLADPFMAQADATITNVATHAFALTTAAFTAIALLASAAARRVTRSELTTEPPVLPHR